MRRRSGTGALFAAAQRGVLIADKWGEIVYVRTASDIGDLPPVEELVEWLEYLEMQCPECQGEAK